jgi:Sugar (and other) transporter
MSVFLMSKYGRRTIIVTGFAFMTLCNLIMAFLFYFEMNMEIVIVTIIYLVFFTTTTGPATFAFCIEVNTDISLGVAMAQLVNSIGLFYVITLRMINALNNN